MATIRFTEPALIALTGGNFKAETEHMKIYPNKLYLINEGETLKFNETSRTSRVYLAVGGGFKLEKWLHSASTDFNVEIGGFEGRKLKKGDEIELKHHYSQRHLKLFETYLTNVQLIGELMVTHCLSIMFRMFSCYKNKGTEDFKKRRRVVLQRLNIVCLVKQIVGMVLDGPQIKAYYDDMPAHQSVKRGTIQVKRDGTPIVLLNDHYTLGSYPQIGTIASYHLTKLAQKPQGSKLKFQFIDIETAEKLNKV